MVKAQLARKQPQDRAMRLLSEFRENPNEETLRKLVNASDNARQGRVEYFGLQRAVKKIFNRGLTERESTLVKRLA